ncbi:MAG: octaprenyl diphosphate synthase [Endozoicomonadaceae bacterium]|nr:octaprenyl diphosphate synthase [Endozoicomonadaceae bacterium]
MLQHHIDSHASIESLYLPVQNELKQVQQFIINKMTSNVRLANQIDQHIFKSNGKKLRPLLVLLITAFCQYKGTHHITLAAIIECLHTATLLHDDVIDHSMMRRGDLTVNQIWGNAPSILTGDFIYSRAFQCVSEIENIEIIKILANVSNTISEGELMQLMHVRRIDITYQEYLDIIYRKTASLFEASAEAAVQLVGGDAQIKQIFKVYGKHLGLTFQLVDDALDYHGDPAQMGKAIGNDFKEGKMTLPLIYTLKQGSKTHINKIKKAFQYQNEETIAEVLKIIHENEAIEYTLDRAKEQAKYAATVLLSLKQNLYRDTLENLLDYALKRIK